MTSTARRARRCGALATFLLALAAPTADAGELRELGTTTGPVKVAADADWTAWSVEENGAHVLVLRAPDGTVSRPPVPPRDVPFDVDLGTVPGGVAATYTRCTTEPRGNQGTPLPVWTSGRGCAVHVLDVATGRERRLARVPSMRSLVLPAISGRSLAFVGVPASRRASRSAVLYVRDLRTGRNRRIGTVPRRDGSDPFGPMALDFNGTRVAVNSHDLNREFRSYDTTISLLRPGGRPVQTGGASQSENCSGQVHGAALSGSGAAWVLAAPGGWIAEAGTRGATVRQGVAVTDVERRLVSAAISGDRVVVADVSDAGAGRIVETQLGPLAKRDAPFELCSG